jgi:hypothetical protein
MTRPSSATLHSYVDRLIRSERYDEEGGYYHFGDGVKCGICTNGARRVAREFGGAVWGYGPDENPAAGIARHLCCGHDFAIVDDRWLVDYWGYRYAGEISHPVLDLRDAGDRRVIVAMFGDPECWKCMAVFSRPDSIPKNRVPMVGQKGFIRLRDLVR